MTDAAESKAAQAERIEYRAKFPAPDVPVAKRVIEYLAPPPIRRHQLLALFDGRANYPQAKAWRMGYRAMPHWAVALLDAKLAERIAPAAKLREELPAAIGPGQGCNLR